MILVIDTIERRAIKLGLFQKDLKFFEIKTENQSEEILPEIEKLLTQKKTTLKDLTTIIVNLGPGSFTGVRIGITVANTLAWSLDIPVVGYKNGDLENVLREISQKTDFQKEKKFEKSVLPFYDTH